MIENNISNAKKVFKFKNYMLPRVFKSPKLETSECELPSRVNNLPKWFTSQSELPPFLNFFIKNELNKQIALFAKPGHKSLKASI